MTQPETPKRTRRSKAQIGADRLAVESAKAMKTAEAAQTEARDGATIKGRVFAAMLATIAEAWDEIKDIHCFTIKVERNDIEVSGTIIYTKPVIVKRSVALETTPNLL